MVHTPVAAPVGIGAHAVFATESVRQRLRRDDVTGPVLPARPVRAATGVRSRRVRTPRDRHREVALLGRGQALRPVHRRFACRRAGVRRSRRAPYICALR
eukprot:scaffold1340_cov253-Pinguiococcus_pyrenoidosus.AAC.45